MKEFSEEFEELADRHGLTVKEKVKVVVKNVDKEMKKFWKRLEGFEYDYVQLKQKILTTYLKMLLKGKPTVVQLVKMVKKLAKGFLEDEEDLDTYYWEF